MICVFYACGHFPINVCSRTCRLYQLVFLFVKMFYFQNGNKTKSTDFSYVFIQIPFSVETVHVRCRNADSTKVLSLYMYIGDITICLSGTSDNSK